jgi:hypothetical protein
MCWMNVDERYVMVIKPQVPVTTLKQFWMRVSIRDSIKLGFGFGIGVTLATLLMSILWYLLVICFGVLIYIPKTHIGI